MSIRILKWPFSKVYTLVKDTNNGLLSATKISDGAKDRMEYITKLAGASTGAAGIGKGTADAMEALFCQDGICFVVSCVGTAADSVQICASFVGGPNVTTLVTTPISIGCKTFVWCCKNSAYCFALWER